MKTKHTPGPWKTADNECGNYVFAPNHAPQICILPAFSPDNKANAALIAAAPDLLAALKWAIEQIEDDLSTDSQAAIDEINSLIAKAENS
jgi:hypothetical protein